MVALVSAQRSIADDLRLLTGRVRTGWARHGLAHPPPPPAFPASHMPTESPPRFHRAPLFVSVRVDWGPHWGQVKPFSKTYPCIPKDTWCLVPASPRAVSPEPDGPGQRSPLHRRFDCPRNSRPVFSEEGAQHAGQLGTSLVFARSNMPAC